MGYFTETEAYKLGAIHETLIKARLYDLYHDEPIKFKELINPLKNPDFLNAMKLNYFFYSAQIAQMYNRQLVSQHESDYKIATNNILMLQGQIEFNKQQ